ncbi:hypothetical protein B0T18DRAFT_214119 [Schizothecium vesticola]|uniref:Uncharacterized protein n=1 Tax=Schizothecium vesticola TaxID=314040 RepID=A0AA40EJT8_9PEZI|nr:hypothetical protein B0T18DRAFT_214119 [Schizothecium vesticola]
MPQMLPKDGSLCLPPTPFSLLLLLLLLLLFINIQLAPPSTTTTTLIRHPLATATSPPPTFIIREPLFLPTDRSPLDLRLLYHYVDSTYASLSSWSLYDPTIHSLLRTTILREALAVPFLMDAILGLSAMHLSYLSPSSPSTPSPAIASLFRARAFSGYRQALAHPSSNLTAIITASIFLCALSTSAFSSSPLYILSWPTLWRGIVLVLHLRPASFTPPPGLAMLFYRPPVDLDSASGHIPSNLLFMLTAHDPASPSTPIYYAALQHLGTLYAELAASGLGPQLDLRVITFLTHVSEEFGVLARAREPKAAVVLAHYVVFLKLTRVVWWMEDVPRRELGPLCELICAGDGEGGSAFWEELARVPRAAMGMKGRGEVVALLLGRTPPPMEEDEGPGEDWAKYGVKTKKLWEATRLGQAAGTPLEDIVRGVVRHPGEGVVWRVEDKSRSERGVDRGSEVVGEDKDCLVLHSPFLGEE